MSAMNAALARNEPEPYLRSDVPTPPEWEAFSRDITVILADPDRFARSQIDRWRSLCAAIQGFVDNLEVDDVAVSEDVSPETVCLARLSGRQRQVMELVVAGRANKVIAHLLNISQRTAENHRAVVMKKTGSRSLPDLVRLALRAQSAQSATWSDGAAI